jgi:PAS domain S-box-containing protein
LIQAEEGKLLSQKSITETLRGLGLTEKDSEVYIFITKKGLLRAYDILGTLKITKAQLYRSLKTLQSKGMVESTFEYPARFSAISFERVLDMFVKAKKEEALRIEENKGFVLSQWKSLALEETPMLFDKFMVIGGKNFLYSKIGQMVKEAKKQILISASDSSIVQAEKAGIMEIIVELGVPFKILTNVTSQNMPVIEKAIAQINNPANKFSGRHINIAERFFPRFVIRDEDELIIIVTSGEGKTSNHKSETGLWTNNRALVDSFRTFFSQLWQDAIDIEKRINEITTGESAPETYLIRDAKEAFKKYVSLISSAQKEVIIMTSVKGLKRALSHKPIMESWRKRKVNVRIMAPITYENESYAKELAKYCEVRNVQLNYVRTVIVDGKELLHMKAAPPDKDTLVPDAYFEDSFYTNDPQYVRGRRELMEDLWNNSADAIESLRRSEARFRSLYENSFDAAMLTSGDGSILSANTAAQSIFGMSEDEIRVAGRAGLLIMDKNAKEAIDERSRTGKAIAELTYRRKDGSPFKAKHLPVSLLMPTVSKRRA